MSNYLAFKKDPLNIQEVTDLVSASSCGAISIFMGTTRDNFDGKPVLDLEYEAYETMGLKAMEKICVDVRKEWQDIENIAIYHRLGRVMIKEVSVIIAVSAPHRAEALKATDFCINRLKQSVPIWKKETYADNAATWKENKELKIQSYPPKRQKFKFDLAQEVQADYIPQYLIQIRATKAELDCRMEKFMERKRTEINAQNNKEFFTRERDPEFSCSRVDATILKRRDSKSHLQVERVLNSYQNRDQRNADYMKKYIPSNGVEERLQCLESQLSMEKAVPVNVYQRIKRLEDRLLQLESISPEYIQFWDKTSVKSTKSVKKKIFHIAEIDELISEVEKKCVKL
ncbi:hypothetical protein ABEB36_002114 [Hypothenemus hampei]|uniref:Molybdopterin synthase catalytic subunit n=1 Tax=Hypothenemus hampei TaxID=57062 RepID=A0ABD1F4Y8_HYPHA